MKRVGDGGWGGTRVWTRPGTNLYACAAYMPTRNPGGATACGPTQEAERCCIRGGYIPSTGRTVVELSICLSAILLQASVHL